MKRLVPATIAAVLTVGTFLGLVYAAGSFNQKLSPNQQIIHALNRLTFGPHPGDVEEVRRIGLAKWIELQLHLDQIPENPVLEAKLKPLATLNMSMADVVRDRSMRHDLETRISSLRFSHTSIRTSEWPWRLSFRRKASRMFRNCGALLSSSALRVWLPAMI